MEQQQSVVEDVMGIADRRKGCWRNQDCNSCLRSKYSCGWCPSSSTCVPSPKNLLSPLNHPVCPLASERYELRTAALGCKCSTYTLLSIIITVFCTLGAVLFVSLVLWLLKWWGRTMRSGGWEIVVEEDGTVREGTWRRGSWWPRWMVARR
ncbi:uncharacterized protein M437DRAFT_57886 [Aureobasidium melanogenum CBS 110374]|uniref:PSI domain-containing protein n=1 Tax=Aureobasidium melanogenum (strain CBS 110374) TaxID=1043003 RepID=A0A074VEG1_AURM1|nr:uncharacterized protein M437DRAFT_57886 [Aureobasidium melanogenum CBS 110374]KEQ59100.1 hypothetical protein M437DRAFT_57886 [Aureobasidium melanogenum CBS 110374]